METIKNNLGVVYVEKEKVRVINTLAKKKKTKKVVTDTKFY